MRHPVGHNRNTLRKASKRRPPDPYARREYTDRSFAETRRELDNQRDYLDTFLTDNETSTPCRSIQVIQDFCDTQNQAAVGLLQPEICLDDREHGTKKSRGHFESLTTDDLRRHLELNRFNLKDHPDADYRQISIRNLNPDSILVLAQTAACHQREVLKDAFSKHISCATSFRIHEKVNGFDTPCLEFHLPYLTLRKISSESDEWKAREPNEEGERWLDMPLPESAARGESGSNRFLVNASHTSIVLCVWDYTKWVGYGFFKGSPASTDSEVDGGVDSDNDSEGVGDAADQVVEEHDPEPTREIFAPDNDGHDTYADDPIRDPRRYFLFIIGVWMNLVVREYRYLVEELGACVKTWRKEDHCRFMVVPSQGPKEDTMQLLHRIVMRKRLLCNIRTHISSLIQEWNDFAGNNGDIERLINIQAIQGRVLLKNLNAEFKELMRLERILSSLIASCEELAGDVQLHMGFENQRFLSKNYQINLESNQLQRKTQAVNLDTQRMSRRTTAAAEKTSHTTRTNVLMIWITTPFLVALQYFGADEPIFSFFERNPRNFGISLCILALAFPILTWVFNHIFDFFAPRFRSRKLQNAEDREDQDTLGSGDIP